VSEPLADTKHDSFTWAWFTVPLSTAGISLLLAGTPNRFTGLTTIGKIFFIFSVALYLIALTLIAVRFITNPKSLRCSLMHPLESLFFPTVLLTC
jgi:tellurite resistance protein TehA-like permease